MDQNNVDPRIRVRINFGNFESLDVVQVNRGALYDTIVSLVPASAQRGVPTILAIAFAAVNLM